MSKVYEIVTDQIIKLMESGQNPWVKPWVGGIGSQKNIVSGRYYTGFNAFVLAMQDCKAPLWLTFKQGKELGISLKKGSKSTRIVGWFPSKSKKDDAPDAEGSEDNYSRLNCRFYNVFNIHDFESLTPKVKQLIKKHTIKKPKNKINKHRGAEQVFKSSGADLRFGESQAYYSPVSDYINMPKKELFNGQCEYYSTLFHELTHWTGHSSRLNRKELTKKARFASKDYSREELCAEMGSVFVCSVLGISTDSSLRNSAAYLTGWLKYIRENPKEFIYACQRAQKATDYIFELSESKNK